MLTGPDQLSSVRLVASVDPAKRREFLTSARATGRAQEGAVLRSFVLKGYLDQSLFCWSADFRDRESRDIFLTSLEFIALKGAAKFLGTVIDLSALDEGVDRSPEPRSTVGPTESACGVPLPAWTVRLVLRVAPEARERFSWTADALSRACEAKTRTWTFEAVDEPDLVCCMWDVDPVLELKDLMHSPELLALEEAARTRGLVESVSLFRRRTLA